MGKILIRPVKHVDLARIACIHKQMFSDHFLGKYSLRTIQNYYVEFIPENVFLVSEKNGLINGFVLGGKATNLNRAKSSFLKKYKISYMVDTLIRPWVYADALSRVKVLFLKNFKSAEASVVSSDSVRLLSIAVVPEVQQEWLAS